MPNVSHFILNLESMIPRANEYFPVIWKNGKSNEVKLTWTYFSRILLLDLSIVD